MDAIFSNNEVVLQNIKYPCDYTFLSEATSSTAWIYLLRQGFFLFLKLNFLSKYRFQNLEMRMQMRLNPSGCYRSVS